MTPSHKDLLINQKTKALHRLHDERLCSTDGNVALASLSSNGYASAILGKEFLPTVLFPRLTSGLRIKESRPAREFSTESLAHHGALIALPFRELCAQDHRFRDFTHRFTQVHALFLN